MVTIQTPTPALPHKGGGSFTKQSVIWLPLPDVGGGWGEGVNAYMECTG